VSTYNSDRQNHTKLTKKEIKGEKKEETSIDPKPGKRDQQPKNPRKERASVKPPNSIPGNPFNPPSSVHAPAGAEGGGGAEKSVYPPTPLGPTVGSGRKRDM